MITRLKLEDIYWHGVGLILLSLCFGIQPANFFTFLTIFVALFTVIRNKPSISLIKSPITLLPVLYLLIMVSMIYTDDLKYGFSRLERYLPLLFIPLSILLINRQKNSRKIVIDYFFIGLAGISIFNIVNAFLNSVKIETNGKLIFDSSIRGGYDFYESILNGGNYFVGGDLSPLIHPSYLSCYLIVAIILIIGFEKRFYWTIPFLIILIFLMSSRAALITIAIVGAYLIITQTKHKLAMFIFLLIFSTGLYLSNPRMKLIYSRVIQLTEKDNFRHTNSEQSRLLTWHASLRLISKSPIVGYGVGDAKPKLLNEFKALRYDNNYRNSYNAHNQYLQIALETGMLGLVLLLAPMILVCFKDTNPYAKSILIIFLCMFTFESMLSRFNGVTFYSIFISLILKGFFERVESNHSKTTFEGEANSKT